MIQVSVTESLGFFLLQTPGTTGKDSADETNFIFEAINGFARSMSDGTRKRNNFFYRV